MFRVIYSKHENYLKKTHKAYKNTNETNLKHMQSTGFKEKFVISKATDGDA